MSQQDILSEILKLEEEKGLNELYIEDMPIWNILKYRLRGYHNVEMGIKDITSHKRKKKRNIFKQLIYFYNSFSEIIKLFNYKRTIPYCFVGFTRLERINDVMIDKFIDPIITECNLNNNEYIYINNETDHPANRSKIHRIVNPDLINSLSLLLSIFVFPILYIRNRRTYNYLKKIIKTYYTVDKKAIVYLYIKSTIIYIQHVIYLNLFRKLKIKSVIGVARPTFLSQSLAAKKLGIKVIELQHGITHGITNLYSGVYNAKIDPDFFCTFGESCPLDVFNIDKTKIINIGFALNSFLKRVGSNKTCGQNCILVISEPAISELMLSIVQKLAVMYPKLEFHIRRHPQEVFSEEQEDRINHTINVKDVSSKECSQLAILPYEYIVGDNSSVLFEAMSIGKKVARFNCEGLIAHGYDEKNDDGFFYINRLNDFETFIKSYCINRKSCNVYSDFDSCIFRNLIS